MLDYSNAIRAAVRAAGVQDPCARAATSTLSPAQTPYVLCPDIVVSNNAARRSGKSNANAKRLLRHAPRHPGGLSFFAAKDSKTAKRIIWQTFKELNHAFGLGLKFRTGDKEIVAPNGYTIWLLGLDEDGEADKLRGATHGLVEGVIDEAATIPDETLRYAVIECALPALGQNGGRLAVSGTPGPLMQGYFYDLCHTRRNFHWDARQNPYLKIGGERFLTNALRDNPGWTESTPQFKREYLGLWCEDMDALIYNYQASRNLIYEGSEFPMGRTVLGVDVGFEDGNGYTVTRTQPPNNPEIHILRSYEKRHQKLPAMAAEIESLRRRYAVNHVFIDEGNNGLMVSKTLNEMGIPCMPTPKGLKRPRIEFVRGGLVSGTIKVLRGQCDTLVGEWGMIPWNEKRTDADERYSNECSDSAIYAILPQTMAYAHLVEEPVIGSREHVRNLQASDKEREENESVTRADLDKMSSQLNRVRGVVKQMTTPQAGYMGGGRR